MAQNPLRVATSNEVPIAAMLQQSRPVMIQIGGGGPVIITPYASKIAAALTSGPLRGPLI